jgi:hypothetical protein
MLTKLMYTLHRILGTVLCILFLAWFLSAFVMMYHGFPKITEKDKIAHLDRISENLPGMSDVTKRIPAIDTIQTVTLNRYMNQTVFHITTNNDKYDLPADSTQTTPPINGEYIRKVATLWCHAPIIKIDTLNQLDQFIPFGKLKKELPIYKFHFADAERHIIYIGSKSGDALQSTDNSSRFWAWMGPIPHWVYFTWLRQNAELWSWVVIILAAFGCLMVIAGLWIAIDVWKKTHRNKHGFSPYKKKWYHWHYVSGIIFGLFALTFCFSGMMSLVDMDHIIKPKLKTDPIEILSGTINVADYSDYRKILLSHHDVRQIEWRKFGNIPYFIVKSKKKTIYLNAEDSALRPLNLTATNVIDAIQKVYGDHSTIKAESINHFELFYRDMKNMYKGMTQLPVWKVTVNDADNSLYYIQPQTGNVKYINTAARWQYWCYTAFHRLRIPGLNESSSLRKSIIWILLLGGSVVSVSGVVLGVRYIERLCRRKKHK